MTTEAVPSAVRLAADIAAQFQHLPVEAAAEQVAAHINKFWEPRMRRQLLEAAASGTLTEPVVTAAAALVRAP